MKRQQTSKFDLGPINFRLLHYFRIVAEEMNFTQAAHRLNMSQPPLSKHIKELEDQLGVKLFLRTTRTMSLTPAGSKLLSSVENLLDQATISLREVQQLGRGEVGHMVVGAVGTSVWGALMQTLQQFTRQVKHATWSLNELTPVEQIIALRQRRIDIAVWREAASQSLPEMACQLLARENFAVALPQDHPLASGDAIPFEVLKRESFIVLPSQERNLGLQVRNLCLKYGFSPVIAHQVNEPQTALALVAEGYGITLLPVSYGRITWPGVRFCPLINPPSADLYVVYDPYATPPLVQEFLQIVRRQVRR
ncbi:LysR family transcriptional regulator [Brenneria izadpanahii]|uniref:LysR family transcriptional regulator n=1 Tax=Brenneria izadpanahii TaxID=2722756 RepID=A0ABX7UVC9_9GAMM|nr:LysR family transcriptional regulator [Brenneria izadpanahii]QTF09749.1 LysR family transcriptional regulator [Brenneria izadpanahii]